MLYQYMNIYNFYVYGSTLIQAYSHWSLYQIKSTSVQSRCCAGILFVNSQISVEATERWYFYYVVIIQVTVSSSKVHDKMVLMF